MQHGSTPRGSFKIRRARVFDQSGIVMRAAPRPTARGEEEVLHAWVDRAVVARGHDRGLWNKGHRGPAAQAADDENGNLFEVLHLPTDRLNILAVCSSGFTSPDTAPYSLEARRYWAARAAFTASSLTTRNSQFWPLEEVGASRASSRHRSTMPSSTGSGFTRRTARWVSIASASGIARRASTTPMSLDGDKVSAMPESGATRAPTPVLSDGFEVLHPPWPVGSSGGEGDGTVSMASIEEAIAAIGRGEMVVVVDDADRENEGDLVMAAEFATPEKVAFFLAYTSGLICVPLTAERADELELPLMVSHNTESQRTAFTVTVDYRYGTTTGISAGDRAATIQALINDDTKPADLARPGHVLPLRYRPGGVLKRAGHTEATLDLARMAGCYPAGLLCEIVTEDKQRMARQPELERFAAEHGLPIISIADLVRYRRHREKLVNASRPPASPPSMGSSSPTGSGRSSTAKSTWPSWPGIWPPNRACSSACTASA